MGLLYPIWPEELLTQHEAQAILQPYADLFVTCWRDGWAEWEALPEEFRGKMTPRDRAGILQSLAVARAKIAFAEAQEVGKVEICQKLGFFKLYIGDRAVVRLKRLGDDHLAKNIRTKQQRRYYWHYPVAGIRQGATRLTVGYSLNQTRTSMELIQASLQFGLEDVLYWFSIDAEVQATPIPIEPISPDVTPTVMPKDVKERKEAQSG